MACHTWSCPGTLQPHWLCFSPCGRKQRSSSKCHTQCNSILLWPTHQRMPRIRQGWEKSNANENTKSIVGSIGWLVQSTRPSLAPSHSFFSAYINKPSRSHLNAALYMLRYIHLTFDYGFTFTSTEKAPLHTYMTFPHSSDTEAYVDALPQNWSASPSYNI